MNTCLACLQVKDPRRMKFPLKSLENSEFNEVVQIDHQKICMTESGYNQILVIIDHFTKLAEAVPCQTASAEETCDHLITHWISRYGCPMTFQSEKGKAFVGDLTKELMKMSHIAQAHSTTYHSQTNGLVERQNRTLVNMLRVYCSRYMTDWDRYLPQVVGAYNSTQHSTTVISPFMMLTGTERAMPLTFVHPEYEGKKTLPQAYVKEAVPSPEDWCVPQKMEGFEYLLVEPACEVNERGTREKNDGNEDLRLDDNEKIEADSDAESSVKEDWNDPEQDEVPKWTEPDLPITAGTRSGNRKRTGMRYNRYGDDFLIDKIGPDELSDKLLSVGELVAEMNGKSATTTNTTRRKTTLHQNKKQIWSRER